MCVGVYVCMYIFYVMVSYVVCYVMYLGSKRNNRKVTRTAAVFIQHVLDVFLQFCLGLVLFIF